MGWKEEVKLAIKDDLLGHFRKIAAQAGDVLPADWLHHEYLPSLGQKEVRFLEEAAAELIREGLLEYVGGRKPTYRLTAKGADSLC